MKGLISKIVKPITKPLVGGLLATALVFSPLTSFAKEKKWDGYFETAVNTNYISGSVGCAIGRKNPEKKGGVIQNYLEISKDVGKGNFTAFGWNSYDVEDGELHEVDVGIKYSRPLTENVSGYIGITRWNYPSKLLGNKPDDAFEAGLSFNLPSDLKFNVDIDYIYGGFWKNGFDIKGSVSKNIFQKDNLFGKGINFSITPKIQAYFLKDFYTFDGVRNVTAETSVNFSKGNWNLGIKGNYQKGTKGDVRNIFYYGASLGYAF